MDPTSIEMPVNGARPANKPIDAGTTQAKNKGRFLEVLAEGTKSYMERVVEKIGSTGATTVYGQPVEREGVTVIPVARALWGFGGGTGLDNPGSDKQNTPAGIGMSFGNGGGGGVMITPLGYIEMAGGKTQFRPIRTLPVALLAIVGGVAVAVFFLRGLRRAL